MKFGVHCSVRGGMITALEEAKSLGCETLQLFTHSPRQWRRPRISEEEASRFRARQKALGLYPLVVHTPYLPNLCTSLSRLYERSVRALIDNLQVCERLGADYLVIHPGAYSERSSPKEGIRLMVGAFKQAFQAPGKTRVLLENMAGGGRRLGSTWEEMLAMLEAIGHPERVGVCLDTAHTWGAGYRFSNAAEVDKTLAEFDRIIGLGKIQVIHANDSRADRGSHRDLHQHIGRGKIGRRGFQALLRRPELQHCAVILETPKDPPGSDRRNLAALRRLL